MIRAALLCLIAVASTAEAGRLYKCIGPDGVTSYQQAECPKASTEAGIRSYVREPDAPDMGWPAQQHLDSQQAGYQPQVAAQPMQQAAPRRRSTASINPMSAEAEMMRRAQHRAGTPEGRALNRSLYGQPAPQPATTTVTDQYGNRYQQPQGSAFVTDERTGKQCFKNGDFLHCD